LGSIDIKLAVENGVPYVAYRDGENGYTGVLKMYDADEDEWVTIEDEERSNFTSDYKVYHLNLVVDNGTVYVAYEVDDWGAIESLEASNRDILTRQLVVRQYDGEAWEDIFKENIMEISLTDLSLKINDGVPYLAYGFYESFICAKSTERSFKPGCKVSSRTLEPKARIIPPPSGGVIFMKFEKDEEGWEASTIGELFHDSEIYTFDFAFLNDVLYLSLVDEERTVHVIRYVEIPDEEAIWEIVGEAIGNDVSRYILVCPA
jgi:hypothetical protein